MKVAVGVSGGVDSAVAALLLKRRGCEVIGVTMTLGRDGEASSLAEARDTADRLAIPLHVVDLAPQWRGQVLDDLRETYLAGATPNPCVRCNERVKFGLLPRYAFETLGCDRFATGHYARLTDGKIFRAADRAKDQSYFLYRVAPDILARTILPLGEFTKAQIREMAADAGIAAADKGDSQDFCGGDTAAIVGEPDREGEIVTEDGRVLGKHRGFWHYTIGKRKGLGIGGGIPYYVTALDAVRNRVIVAFKERTFRDTFAFSNAVWFSPPEGDLAVKVRSAGEPKGPVRVQGAICRLATPIAGIAPGQSAVFYRGDEIIGGGIIA